MSMKVGHDSALHAFRGFAILCVVAIHSIGFILFYAKHEAPGLNVESASVANEIIFHDSTIFFALISGILFSKILINRGWFLFYQNKLRNVVAPYLFFTICFTGFHWNNTGDLIIYSGSFFSFLQLVGVNLITGNALFAFWYIPVLIVLYLLTPAIMNIVLNTQRKLLLTILMCMPLFLSRSWPDIIWQNFAYFIGAYTIGLAVGVHYAKASQKIIQYKALLWGVFVVSTLLLGLLFHYDIGSWKGISPKESIFYLQKIALSALVLGIFQRLQSTNFSLLNTLGFYAFPIFFMHGFMLFAFYLLLSSLGIEVASYTLLFIACILQLIFTLLFCILLSRLLKMLLGKHSRYFIGV